MPKSGLPLLAIFVSPFPSFVWARIENCRHLAQANSRTGPEKIFAFFNDPPGGEISALTCYPHMCGYSRHTLDRGDPEAEDWRKALPKVERATQAPDASAPCRLKHWRRPERRASGPLPIRGRSQPSSPTHALGVAHARFPASHWPRLRAARALGARSVASSQCARVRSRNHHREQEGEQQNDERKLSPVH